MPYKFKTNNYDAEKASKPRSALPDAGSIVGVRILGRREVEFDWAGTKETTSKSNRPMLQVHCEVLPGFRGAGCWMLDYIMLDSEYTDQRVGALLDATGHDMSAAGFVLDADDLVGRVAYVRVKHEEYEGEPRARVAYWIVHDQYEALDLDPLPGAEAAPKPRGKAPGSRDDRGGGFGRTPARGERTAPPARDTGRGGDGQRQVEDVNDDVPF